MEKVDLEELLLELYDYMENLADVEDTDSSESQPQGIAPNQEMKFMTQIKSVLEGMGVDPDAYKIKTKSKFETPQHAKDAEDTAYGTNKDADDYAMDRENDREWDDPLNESIVKIKSNFKRFL